MPDAVHADFDGPQTFPDLCDRYSDFIDGCIELNYMVRSVDLQRKKADEIDGYVLGIKGIKAQAVDRAEEDIARLMFHFQCMLRSVQSALRVWVELKAGGNVRAWSNLVDAQEYCEVALFAGDHSGARTLEMVLKRMQECLFPTFKLFNSPGTIETVGRCSICWRPSPSVTTSKG